MWRGQEVSTYAHENKPVHRDQKAVTRLAYRWTQNHWTVCDGSVCVFVFLCVQFAQTVQAVQQETSCSLGGWELLSKMEFRLSDAGRLLEAGVGSKAEDVTDGQAGGGDGRLSSPPCAIYIFHRICAHTPCCHNIDTFLLLVKIEEEEVWHNLQSSGWADKWKSSWVLICQDCENQDKGNVRALLRHIF